MTVADFKKLLARKGLFEKGENWIYSTGNGHLYTCVHPDYGEPSRNSAGFMPQPDSRELKEFWIEEVNGVEVVKSNNWFSMLKVIKVVMNDN